MKNKLLLLFLSACAGTLTSCEMVGNMPLTATVSLWGEGWEVSTDIVTISTQSSKNPISWEDGVDIVVESSKNPIE